MFICSQRERARARERGQREGGERRNREMLRSGCSSKSEGPATHTRSRHATGQQTPAAHARSMQRTRACLPIRAHASGPLLSCERKPWPRSTRARCAQGRARGSRSQPRKMGVMPPTCLACAGLPHPTRQRDASEVSCCARGGAAAASRELDNDDDDVYYYIPRTPPSERRRSAGLFC